jgi:precorrin-4/cobalt-precorrin-4 C11-methyltransferase
VGEADLHRVEFIGAGPGHPDLLTLGGARALQSCLAALAPASFHQSFSRLLEGKEVESPFQMDHDTVVSWIETRLARGHVAFLMPGDFSSFCPFQSFVAHFGDRSRIIPGVSAHAAAAALLRRSLDLPAVAHATVLTSSRAFARSGERVRLRDYARPGHTLVVYMNDLPLPELVSELRAGFQSDVPIAILENVSCPDEVVTYATLDTIEDLVDDRDPFGIGSNEPEPALALVVAGDALGKGEDPSWWNRRHERIWKPRGLR